MARMAPHRSGQKSDTRYNNFPKENTDLEGTILHVMVNNKFLLVQVKKFMTHDSFPDGETAILKYKIDDDLKVRNSFAFAFIRNNS